MDYSPPSSSVHGILQARIPEWVAMVPLQGIFLIQGLNPHLVRLLHWQAGYLPQIPPGKPIFLSYIVRISIGRYATNGYLLALMLD